VLIRQAAAVAGVSKQTLRRSSIPRRGGLTDRFLAVDLVQHGKARHPWRHYEAVEVAAWAGRRLKRIERKHAAVVERRHARKLDSARRLVRKHRLRRVDPALLRRWAANGWIPPEVLEIVG